MINAREAALKALVEIEKDNLYANLALPRNLRQLSSEKRAFCRSIVYGTIRHKNTIDWVITLYLARPLASLTPFIRNLLRSAAYQVLYLSNIPRQVTVDETVKLAYRYGHKGVAGLVNAVMRRVASMTFDELPWPHKGKEKESYLSLYYSIPGWLVKRWIKRFGFNDTVALCRAHNRIPALNIRTNLLKNSRDDLMSRLLSEGIETRKPDFLPEALTIQKINNLSLTGLLSFNEGFFSVQGESSMIAGRILNPLPGTVVLDICSAPGGKTTHLAELMKDEGTILARDIHPSRIKLVEKQAKRLGLKIIETKIEDAVEKVTVKEPVDYILCDAPCSGLGVLNRKPDLKWQKNEEQIKQLAILQKKILSQASKVLKPGGRLLYSVCTNEYEETTEVAEFFLKNNPDFRVVPTEDYLSQKDWFIPGNYENKMFLEILPHINGIDGFFMALFERKY